MTKLLSLKSSGIALVVCRSNDSRVETVDVLNEHNSFSVTEVSVFNTEMHMNRHEAWAVVFAFLTTSVMVGCSSIGDAITDAGQGIKSLGDKEPGTSGEELANFMAVFGRNPRTAYAVSTAMPLDAFFRDIQRRQMTQQESDTAQAEAREAINRDFSPEVRETYSNNSVFVAVPRQTRTDSQGVKQTEYVIADAKTGELVSDEAIEVPTESAAEVSKQSQNEKRPVNLGKHRVVMLPPNQNTA
jgi:hypothetical protein